jgi:hypothetical protein
MAFAFTAQSNDIGFKQTQGDDGRWHSEITVSYAYPGLPPRTGNSGVGTVRVKIPNAAIALESVDSGYQCATEAPDTIACSTEGLAQDGGTAFPASMTLRVVSQDCLTQAGSADVWAAAYDPGGAPDVSLPIEPSGCGPGDVTQPVLDTKESCKVPNLKNLTLRAAARELAGGDCTRGKVSYAYSPKVKKGRVMKQSARPGKTLKAGASVNLVISRGKKPGSR